MNDHDKSPSDDRLESLRRALRAGSKRDFSLMELPDETAPAVGQVWFTRIGLDSDLDSDPSPVVVLLGRHGKDVPFGDELFDAAPMFEDASQAGPFDALVPPEIMGRSWAVALDQVITIDRVNLLTPMGGLPGDFVEKLQSMVEAVEHPMIEELLRGLPYLSDGDPRIRFHRELLRSTYPMQQAAFQRHEEKLGEMPEIIPTPTRKRISSMVMAAADDGDLPPCAVFRSRVPMDGQDAEHQNGDALEFLGTLRESAKGFWDLAELASDESIRGRFWIVRNDDGSVVAKGEITRSVAKLRTSTGGDLPITGLSLIFWPVS